MARWYAGCGPKSRFSAHGEAVHLSEHARFARAQGVGEVVRALNGDLVQLAPGTAAIVGQLDHGRVYKDGEICCPPGDDCIGQRRRLSFSGVISIALALSSKGDLAGGPRRDDRRLAGPHAGRGRHGRVVDSAIFEAFESLPRGKRRDADVVSTAIERAVRNAVNGVWGKKPAVHVLVVEV